MSVFCGEGAGYLFIICERHSRNVKTFAANVLQVLLYYKLVDLNRLRIDNKIDMEIYIGINSKKRQLFIRITYRVVQKKRTVLLSTSLAWLAVAGCSRAETFSQLSSISFAQPCTQWHLFRYIRWENKLTMEVTDLVREGH